MSLADKFNYLNGTKVAIKEAIIAKGVTVGSEDPFRSFAAKISSIVVEALSEEEIDYPIDAPDIVSMLNHPWFTGKESYRYVLLFVDPLQIGVLHRDSTRFTYSLSYSDDLATVLSESNTNFIPIDHTWASTDKYKFIFMTMTRSVSTLPFPFFWGVRSAWANWMPLVSDVKSKFVSPLATIPEMTFSSMFYQARYLRTMMVVNTSLATSLYNMFYQCSALSVLPLLDTGSCTSLKNMLTDCVSLRSVPALNTANCLDFSGFMSGCYGIPLIPPLNTSAGTLFSEAFKNCYSLRTLLFNDEDPVLDPDSWSFGASVSFDRSPLTKNSIVGVFNRLKGSGAIITISFYTNKLNSDIERAIATGKGWTVSVSTTY
ncbi:MAG: hypothetical protein CVV52_04020 [Spirochaetae bacterium HGW-Spirochaetae-8]|jgi:hypothetical protein|nr:MAG: hypothetical protein CVV52_04020 [Spirochaetae bacterium HGW-Spirochaetae-8]